MKKIYSLLFIIGMMMVNITYAQNVGVGTPFPASKLHIASGNQDGILIGNYNDQMGWNGAGPAPATAIRFAGYRDVVPNFTGAKIEAFRTDICCSALSQGTGLSFQTQPNTATVSGDGNLIEQMRITNNIQINSLAGSGTRVVTADANGILSVNPNIGTAPITDCSSGNGTYTVTIVVYYNQWCQENSWELRTGTTWNSGRIVGMNQGTHTGTCNSVVYNSTVTLDYGTTYYLQARDASNDGWDGGGYFSITGGGINTGNITVTGSGVLYTFRSCVTNVKNQRMLRGNIASNGFADAGGGFNTTKLGTGLYRINFITPFSETPSVSAIQLGNGNTRDNVLAYDLSATGVTFKTGDSGGDVSDRPFSFIIMGTE